MTIVKTRVTNYTGFFMQLQLLFNKTNKEFIGYGANGHDHLNKSNLLIKEIEIPDGSFNVARYVWSGNYDHGELIDLNAGPAIVLETDVAFKNYDILARKVNLDVYAIQRLCEMSFDDFQNFIVMRDTINAKIKKEIEFFSKSKLHKFVPRVKVKETLEKTLKV